MAWKQTGQLSLADSLINAHKAIEELDELHNLIDWQPSSKPSRHVHSSERGNLPFTLSSCLKYYSYKNSITYRIQPWKNNWHETYYFVALLAYH